MKEEQKKRMKKKFSDAGKRSVKATKKTKLHHRQSQEQVNNCFWDDLDRHIRRTQKFLNWKIDGQFQHGISPMMFPNLTPERVEEIYNVYFGD